MKIAIACIVKNEFDYILEWLAYHRSVIGIQDFIIADNVSTDGTTQLLEALDSLKVIKRIHFPRVEAEKGIQVDAYNYILSEYGSKYDYICFIDADEFIVNNSSVPFETFLKKSKPDALALNWRIFGSSGQYYQTNKLVIDRFTLASRHDHKYNHHIKTVLNPACVNTMYVHHASLKKGRNYLDCTKDKMLFIEDLKDFKVLEHAITPFSKVIRNNDLYVAHFVVKSKSEHMDKKASRGSAAGSALRQKGIGYFKGHDLNQVECLDLKKHNKTVLKEFCNLDERLVKETTFYSHVRYHIDRFDQTISGWVSLQHKQNIVIKILAGEVKEFEFAPSVKRKDVYDIGLSEVELCGFSIDISAYKKEQLKIWIKGSNVVLWDGARGY